MYKIDLDSVKKMIETNNLLNNLEIRGISNLGFLYNSILNIQEILKKIEELNKDQQGIVIDNTKKGGQ